MRFTELFPPPLRDRRARPWPTRAFPLLLAAMAAPALVWAHERWVPNTPRFPINRAYFQSLSGEVLFFVLTATATVFGVVLFWYLYVPDLIERLTPVTASGRAREAKRGFFSRGARLLARLALDGDIEGRVMTACRSGSVFLFSKVPAAVLLLGAAQSWLVMPSYPVSGSLGDVLRIVSAVLAVWILSGFFLRPVGAIFFLIYVYLCFAYGIVAIDAIPVLASAFFYLFSPKQRGAPVTARQLLGMRISLGVGFFLLGLINKIYLAELFIGVGDQHPQLLIGPQTLVPGLTREAWSFTTALGEMVFGLLLLMGVFNRITTLVLALVFANFIFVFGAAEIVHIYPIAGFLLLFFRGPLGTSLDGLVFRANVRFWHAFRHTSSRLVYAGAVTSVATTTAVGLFFMPLVAITEVVPELTGSAVPRGYVPPPLPPPAKKWASMPAEVPTSVPTGPHQDHTPRKGGVVTMTGDSHVEIVVLADGTVLLYASDAVRTPIAPSEVRGNVRVERPGMSRLLPLQPDASGALVAAGPPPTITTNYTYLLTIRGAPASMTLAVPPGGTAAFAKTPPR